MFYVLCNTRTSKLTTLSNFVPFDLNYQTIKCNCNKYACIYLYTQENFEYVTSDQTNKLSPSSHIILCPTETYKFITL